jgi:hypothetical protein
LLEPKKIDISLTIPQWLAIVRRQAAAGQARRDRHGGAPNATSMSRSMCLQ